MKKIRMLTAMSGIDFSWAPGEIVEVADDIAAALCSEPVDQPRAEMVGSRPPAAAKEVATASAQETRQQSPRRKQKADG